jgi:polysaccharide biosynthesis transport protein
MVGWEIALLPAWVTLGKPARRTLRGSFGFMRSYVSGLPALHVEPEPASGVEITDVFRVLWRRRMALAVAFVLLSALGYGIIKLLPQRYSSEAVLILEVSGGKAVDVDSAAAQLIRDRAVIKSETDVLSSRGLAEQVVDKLDLMQDPEFNLTLRSSAPPSPLRALLLAFLPAPLRDWLGNSSEPADQVPPEQVRTMVVNAVLSRLTVDSDNNSNTVHLDVQSDDPATAAALANAFTDLYLENDHWYKQATTEHAAAWIKGKLDELRQQAIKADQAVLAFQKQHQIIDVDHAPLIDQQLAELSKDLSAASATRMQRQSEVEALRRAGNGPSLFGVPQIAASPLVQELRSQQNLLLADRAELASQLGPRQPRMVEVESRLRELQDRLDREVARVRAQIQTGFQIASAQEQALSRQLDALKSQREAADRAGITLRQLTSEAAAAHSLFDVFVQGLGRNVAEVGVSEANARVISRAVPALFASFPPRNLLLLLTAVLALLLALVWVAVLELLDRGYRDPRDLERAHGIPVLGEIPLSPLRGVGHQHPSMAVIAEPESRFTDAVQTVYTALGCGQEHRVVLITSALAGEGKTSLATALGRLAACSGKHVLLIDCDLRHPAVGRSLDQVSTHGVAELWEGRATIEQAFCFDVPSGLMFLPASGSVPFPGVILSSDFLYQLIEQARERFDLILLDSPPVGIVSDAMALSALADATIMAVRWGRTPRSALAAAAKKLAAVGRPALAAVLSHVDLKRYSKYCSTIKSENYFAGLERGGTRKSR